MIACSPERISVLKRVTNYTVDITEWLDFAFHDLVWFHYDLVDIPKLGQWLGILHCVGSHLCYYVYRANGSVKLRTTVQHIPREDLIKPIIAAQVK